MDDVGAMLAGEGDLVTRAATEPAAFVVVYDKYYSRVYNYIRYHFCDAEAADDVTAQVFEKALAKIDGFCPERGPFSSWLFAIARNTVISHLRTQRRRRLLSLDGLLDRLGGGRQPEQAVIRNETYVELLVAIARLDERKRDLVALKFAAGLTNRRIAELTGLSESNVGVILYRTVRWLRSELDSKR